MCYTTVDLYFLLFILDILLLSTCIVINHATILFRSKKTGFMFKSKKNSAKFRPKFTKFSNFGGGEIFLKLKLKTLPICVKMDWSRNKLSYTIIHSNTWIEVNTCASKMRPITKSHWFSPSRWVIWSCQLPHARVHPGVTTSVLLNH